MSKGLQAFLTVLTSWAVVSGVLLVISAATGGALDAGVALALGTVVGLGYGLEAGLLYSYDLSKGVGWGQLLVDLTWSLPNTVFGFIFGNLIYIWFANPSRTASEGEGWIVFMPRASSTSSFGRTVLQTLGTVNIGGAGNHEKVHLLQARIFGPLYLLFVGASYAITFTLQVLWTITLGGLLKLLGVRQKAYFRPPSHSAVSGFFGWIYYATPIELWAYGTEAHH